MTTTTIGLSVSEVERTYAEEARSIHPVVPQQVRVFAPGVAMDADVVVELQRLRNVAPHEGGGQTSYRVGAICLTRDEATNLIRAIQRALGIDPDALR